MNTEIALVLTLRAISTLLPATQQSTTPYTYILERENINLHILYSMAGDIDMLVQPSSAFIGRAFNACLYLTSAIGLVHRPDTHNRNASVKIRPQTHLKSRCKLWIQYMIVHSSGQSGWEVGVSGLGCSTSMSKGHIQYHH